MKYKSQCGRCLSLASFIFNLTGFGPVYFCAQHGLRFVKAYLEEGSTNA